MLFMKKYKEYLILIIFTMGTQAAVYFLIKIFIHDYHIINSFINFPIVKPFVYFYDIWYPFIILNTFLIYLYNKKIFKYLIVTMLLGALLSHITFVIYPSMIIRPDIIVNNITDWILDFTYRTDTPAVNCLPSMHCVYCFVTSFYILKCNKINIKYRSLIVTISMLIVLSTLLIKQHIIEDVILSLIYTTIVIIFVYLNRKNIDKLFKKINL